MKKLWVYMLIISMVLMPMTLQGVYAVETNNNIPDLKVSAVSSNSDNTAVLAADGTVWAWGDNSNGQLGAGENLKFSNKPLKIMGFENSVSVSVGSGFILALRSDGTVWGIGSNFFGEISDSKSADKLLSPVQVPGISGIKAISAGVNYAMALNEAGEVYIWGLYRKQSSSQKKYASELAKDFSGAKMVLALKHNAVAIKKDGTVWTFRGTRLEAEEITNINNMVSVIEGIKRTFAVDSAGDVWHWGINGKGAAKLAGISDIKELYDADGYSTIALDNKGSVWQWDNEKLVPRKIFGVGSVSAISAGNKHIAFIKNDGTLWTWGDNGKGQLGIGVGVSEPKPLVVPGINNIKEISASDKYILALKNDGTVWAWGDNSYGQLGTGHKVESLTPVKIEGLNNIISISAGYTHAMAVKEDGTLWAWGSNGAGELGDGTYENRLSPVQVKDMDKVIAVSAGKNFTVALRSNRQVWAWGNSGYTRDNDSMYLDRSVPRRVQEIDNVKYLDTGKEFVITVRNNESIWGWGGNNYGQIGSNKKDEDMIISVPKSIGTVGGIRQISAGESSVLALGMNGKVYSWGNNDFGQLGVENKETSSTKVVIKDLEGTSFISAGRNHCFAIKDDGTLWAWGDNTYGQLGVADTKIMKNPVPVEGLAGVKQIFAGFNYTMAVMADGTLKVWGNNSYGQLGIGKKGIIESSIPVQTRLVK